MHRKLSGAAALIVAAAFVTAEEALLLAFRAELDETPLAHDPLAR
jgi:hypothetical protein